MSTHHTLQIPILLGPDYRHVMGIAEVVEDPDEGNANVVLSITATGKNASDLVAILTSGGPDPMAIQFVAIPVGPRITTTQGEH